MTDYIYRFGTLADVDGITEIMTSSWLALMSEAWGNYFSVNKEGIRAWMTDFITKGNAALVVTTSDGEIVGGMGLMITRYFWANEDVICEHGIFIHPDHRKSRIAINLIKWAKNLATEHKMPLIVGQISRLEHEKVEKFYTKICGLSKIGGHFTFTP